ncbi:MAG: hypothetical protein KAI64_00550, partial [Thermoplasmata archaeon]|nr:hypothetical protein [Thermoplasmata archaeon]
GIFATENIILADFRDTTWIGEVSSWLNNSENESAEQANGLDHIPDTSDYSDGDGIWTVDRFTDQDAANGLIPDGMSVGDIIPGSGEDIDGDAVMDNTISINDYAFPATLKDKNWTNWIPIEWLGADIELNYGQFANANGPNNMNHVDGLLYTNNSLVGSLGKDQETVELYGGLISRVECLVINTPNSTGTLIHDERFTGGGSEFGFFLPKVKKAPQLVSWRETSTDYQLPGTVVAGE